jgi:hypothetical protein
MSFLLGYFDAELYGVYQALLYATTFNLLSLSIYLHLDNQMALYTIARPSLSSSAYAVCKVVNAISFLKPNNTEVHISWTLGHIRIIGYEPGDKVAKYTASLTYNKSLL